MVVVDGNTPIYQFSLERLSSYITYVFIKVLGGEASARQFSKGLIVGTHRRHALNPRDLTRI